jgi:Tfp pilus assembly protein PilE
MYQKIKNGFTIIELSLAIAFIAILSITVVLMINNAVSAYHRGITLNQLNTTGMDVVEDIRKAIQESPARIAKNECSSLYNDNGLASSNKSKEALTSCEENEGQSFVSLTRLANVQRGNNSDATLNDVPISGVFCTGKYSYIWNSGYLDEKGDYRVNEEPLKFTYKKGSSVKIKEDFKLLKIQDDTRAVCKAAAGGLDGEYRKNITVTDDAIDISCKDNKNKNVSTEICTVLEAEPEDILGENSNLALYSLTVGTPAMGGNLKTMLYSASFVLGTIQGGINVQTSGNYCATPEGAESDVENFDYCAINKFNFAAQTTGG